MKLAFLDFALLLLILYLVTQIFIPLVIPKKLDINWIFKKSKSERLINQQARIKSDAAEMIGKSKAEVKEANKEFGKLKKLFK